MARKRNKAPVPGVLWRLYRDRARTLSDTIIFLLPPPPQLCCCGGRRCLGCTLDAKSFLLRPGDPSDYRKLLAKCYVVVSENAPSVPFFVPPSGLPQDQIVKRTIERMLHGREPTVSNVLCSGYDRSKCSSPIVEILSCASWCLLLSRVGEDFMVYLLRNTSIFLPVPHGKHHQVGGPLISRLCFDMLKCSPKFHYQKYGSQKRKRADADDLTVEKRKCHISYGTNGSLGFSSNLGLIDKSSMQLTRHHGSRNYDVSVSEVPKLTRTGTVIRALESEGKQGSNCITPRLGKHSRPFSWQRRSCKMQKQLTFEENSLNTHCNVLPTNTDCLHASFQPNTTSLSNHAKLQMSWQCSCCLILQSLPSVPKRTDIKRQSIFYNLESCSLLPKKHILYFLKPNLACSKHLIGNIFGFSDVNDCAQPMPCLHSNGSCLIDSGCLYHSLVKWFKHLIRRTRCCQHMKLLNKHCVFPSLDKHTIGRSCSRLKVLFLSPLGY
ncbi:Telomerase reverse transcriptase [Spatholobus suberectus]|nr:Telomerase reverse transcriptase [Spatholobus suberectus]